jgi:hypothetical protein
LAFQRFRARISLLVVQRIIQLGPQIKENYIDRQSIEPSRRPGLATKGVGFPNNLYESVLSQILGNITVAGHP